MNHEAVKRLTLDISRLLHMACVTSNPEAVRYLLKRISTVSAELPPEPCGPATPAEFIGRNRTDSLLTMGSRGVFRLLARNGEALLVQPDGTELRLSKRARVEVDAVKPHVFTVKDGRQRWRLGAYAPMNPAETGIKDGAALATAVYCDCELGSAVLTVDGFPAVMCPDTFNEMDMDVCEPPFGYLPCDRDSFKPFETDGSDGRVEGDGLVLGGSDGKEHVFKIHQPVYCK